MMLKCTPPLPPRESDRRFEASLATLYAAFRKMAWSRLHLTIDDGIITSMRKAMEGAEPCLRGNVVLFSKEQIERFSCGHKNTVTTTKFESQIHGPCGSDLVGAYRSDKTFNQLNHQSKSRWHAARGRILFFFLLLLLFFSFLSFAGNLINLYGFKRNKTQKQRRRTFGDPQRFNGLTTRYMWTSLVDLAEGEGWGKGVTAAWATNPPWL